MIWKTLVFLTSDFTKEFLQSTPSQCLVYLISTPDFSAIHPACTEKIWRAKIQQYDDVEAGLYGNRTFNSWLNRNIMDATQSMYDPAMLFSLLFIISFLFCTGIT